MVDRVSVGIGVIPDDKLMIFFCVKTRFPVAEIVTRLQLKNVVENRMARCVSRSHGQQLVQPFRIDCRCHIGMRKQSFGL